MNTKSSIASIANELEKMPDRVVKKYPGRSVLGALAIGFVLAKIARHV